MNATPTPSEDLSRIISSAKRLGVEMDEAAALQWLTAAAATQGDTDDVVVDITVSVLGEH